MVLRLLNLQQSCFWNPLLLLQLLYSLLVICTALDRAKADRWSGIGRKPWIIIAALLFFVLVVLAVALLVECFKCKCSSEAYTFSWPTFQCIERHKWHTGLMPPSQLISVCVFCGFGTWVLQLLLISYPMVVMIPITMPVTPHGVPTLYFLLLRKIRSRSSICLFCLGVGCFIYQRSLQFPLP